MEEQTVDVQKQTEIVLAWKLDEHGLRKSAIPRRWGRHRDTIIEWLKGIEQFGLRGFWSLRSKPARCRAPAARWIR